MVYVNVEVFFFFTTTASVTDQFRLISPRVTDWFWLISRRVTDWFWLISFNDNCSFFFVTAFFVANSIVIVTIKRINKVFPIFKRLLFRAWKFKQQRKLSICTTLLKMTRNGNKWFRKCRDYWSYWECQRFDGKIWEPFQGNLIVKNVFSTNIWSDDAFLTTLP